MDNVIRFNNAKCANETWTKKLIGKVKDGAKKTWDFVVENKEIMLIVIPGVIGCTTAGVKAIGKRVNLRKQEAVKNLYCYDRSLGHYWALKRELSNKEWVSIDQRKRSGERLADILEELKVLK